MSKIKDGSTYLSNHLTANDYYCENEIVFGRWIGEGSKLMGIEHQNISKKDIYFERLRKNLHPLHNHQLTPRNVKDRISFYDFQCSAPKSVSIMAVTIGDERLRKVHEEALTIAFKELEKFAARQCYIESEHKNAFTSNLCSAAFTHDSSRALDPQLHTHVVVANATYDKEESKWYALETQHMCKAIRYAGQVYTNELAIRVQQLGYNIKYEKTNRGIIKTFQIDGVKKETLQLYSKRRKEIEKEIKKFIEKYGREPRSDEIHVISKKTRSVKLEEISTAAVRKHQMLQLSMKELKALQGLHASAVASRKKKGTFFENPKIALSAAKDHLFERNSLKPAHAILAETLNQNLGRVCLEDIKQEVKADNDLFKLHKDTLIDGLYDAFTTQENIFLEKSLLDMVNASKNKYTPLKNLVDFSKNAQLSRKADFDFPLKSLEEDQIIVFENFLGSTDQIQSLRGPAGSGKSYLLKAVQNFLQSKGINLFFQATTHSAASNLLLEGFSECSTLSKFLLNPEKAYSSISLQNSFWILDEASLASAKQMYAYLTTAQKYNARILLVGDTKQHSGVEAGDALAVLENHSSIQQHSLTQIRRQRKNPAYLKAAQLMSKGKVMEGLNQLDSLGWIKDGMDYLELAAQQYLENRQKSIPTLLVSPTWEEINHLNQVIRQKKKEIGLSPHEISPEVFKAYPWTKAQLRACKNYEPEMHLCLIQDLAMGSSFMRQGTILHVERIDKSKLIVREKGKSASLELTPHALGNCWITGNLQPLPLSIGDMILLQRNDKALGLKNNSQLEVKSINQSGHLLAKDSYGQEYTIPPNYHNFTYGYAITSHKSQGLTREEVIIAAREMDALAKYVSTTRGQSRLYLFTQNKKTFLGDKIINTPKNRLSALDYMRRLFRNKIFGFSHFYRRSIL